MAIYPGNNDRATPSPPRRILTVSSNNPAPATPCPQRNASDGIAGVTSSLPSTPQSLSRGAEVNTHTTIDPTSDAHVVDEIVDVVLQAERSGVYEDDEGNMRAYALNSPMDPSKRRPKTELDLYLPKEHETWAVPGKSSSIPACLPVQTSVR